MARDWNALKAEYVAGTMSYRELAEKHNIPPSTLMKAATKGKWREGRTKYGESLVAVSYTHLDVYKRQQQRGWNCNGDFQQHIGQGWISQAL